MSSSLAEFLRDFDRSSLSARASAATAKREEICKKFPKEAWETMPLDRYALGTPKYRDSFCYFLEYASDELGSIAGGNAEKLLIYWSEDLNGWKFDTKLYKSVEDAWDAIRAGFVQALQFGEAERFAEVDEIPALSGARVLRAKFLSIYFPSAILPIFSREHLEYFRDALGEPAQGNDSRKTVALGQRLKRRLAEIPILRGWSNDELMGLLYRWNPPQPESMLLKIAPGEGARFWKTDCLPNGIICVGWDDVGDLRQYRDFAAFREAFQKAYSEGYGGDQSIITRKAKELWKLRDLHEGDQIAANLGLKEILAVGDVLNPGYHWDPSRQEFRHTVKVNWDLNRGGSIEPVKRWGTITVEKITGPLRDTILSLRRSAVSGDSDTRRVTLKSGQVMPTKPTNLILYGPPGTGKTYELQQLEALYTELPQAQDRSAWLQALVANYNWREVIAATLNAMGKGSVPEIRDHELIQAKVRQRQITRSPNPQIWGRLQRHTPESTITVQTSSRTPPYIFTKSVDSVWSLLSDWRSNDEESAQLSDLYKGGMKSGAPPIKRYRQITFHPSFSYEDFIRGIRPVPTGEDGQSEFRLVDGVFKQICDEARLNPAKRYALFIDEINRGNIAKIFGELITLIEPDKRVRIGAGGVVLAGMTVRLPGESDDDVIEAPFGVPENLDIYGTMNTADRSIALIDIALRRRFEFQEVEPRYDKLQLPVAGVDCAALLRRINDRLEFLLDRDRRIGHAYLMKAHTIEELRKVFANQIIPLLQEYFFDDLGKVALTLSGPDGNSPFIRREAMRHDYLFPGVIERNGARERFRYLVTDMTTWNTEAFAKVYSAPSEIEEGPVSEGG